MSDEIVVSEISDAPSIVDSSNPGEWLGGALDAVKDEIMWRTRKIKLGTASSAAEVAEEARKTVEHLLGCDCKCVVEETSTDRVIFLQLSPMVERVHINIVVK